MDPYEIVCQCVEGKMIRRCSKSQKNRNRMYYCCPKSKKTETREWDWGCGNFLWEDKVTQSSSGVGSSSGSSGSTPPPIPHGSSTPTTNAEKRIKSLSEALEISQNANRALVDIIHDLAKLPLDN